MPFITTWLMFSGPYRLMAMIFFQNSGSVFRKLAARSQPALLTRNDVGPDAASNVSTARFTAS